MRFFVLFLCLCHCCCHPLSSDPLTSLPFPTGIHQVGIAKFDLNDPYRKQPDYPKGRLIPIQIYFPLSPGKSELHSKVFEEHAPDKWPPLEVQVYAKKADLSELTSDSKHPIILLNHGDAVPMTDYAAIAEDLASQGYVVIAIQHQLKTDSEEPPFWKERSISKYGNVIDNILYVFQWIKENQTTVFQNKLDLHNVRLIGHSMGGNALLLFMQRASNIMKQKQMATLLPHTDPQGIHEAVIVLDTGGFPFPSTSQFPLFMLFAEEKETYHKNSEAYQAMVHAGHKVKYYKGAKHVSFMDHGYLNPKNPINPNEDYFNGTVEERKAFFDQLRQDIRNFLKENGIYPSKI